MHAAGASCGGGWHHVWVLSGWEGDDDIATFARFNLTAITQFILSATPLQLRSLVFVASI